MNIIMEMAADNLRIPFIQNNVVFISWMYAPRSVVNGWKKMVAQ